MLLPWNAAALPEIMAGALQESKRGEPVPFHEGQPPSSTNEATSAAYHTVEPARAAHTGAPSRCKLKPVAPPVALLAAPSPARSSTATVPLE